MKKLPEKLISMCLLLAFSSACIDVALATEGRVAFRPGDWTAVKDEQLDNTRGGFDVGPGLNVSFGIVRTITINGDLINRTSFDLPDVTRITAEQAKTVNTAIAESGFIQNGASNFVDAGFRSGLTGGTIIQNSLNDQRIQTLTVINTGVNSLGLLKALNTQGVLNDALFGSVGFR